MSGKKRLYKPAGNFDVHGKDKPDVSPGTISSPRSGPPPITPLPMIHSELSDPDLSPGEEPLAKGVVPLVHSLNQSVTTVTCMLDSLEEKDHDSTSVPVITSQTPSSIKVVREDEIGSLKRFSSSFVKSQDTDNHSNSTVEPPQDTPSMSLQHHLIEPERPQQSASGDLPVKRDQAGAVDGGDSLGKFESEGFGGQLEEKVHDLLEQSAEVKRKKVKKGKIVPSRYKAAASSFKKPSSTLNATESRQERKSAKNKNVHGKTVTNTSLSTRMTSNQSFHSGDLSFKLPSNVATSTPAPSSGKLKVSEPSSAQAGSFLGSQSSKSLPKEKVTKKRMADRIKFLERKLLQAVYLDVVSYSALKKQEEQVQKQVYALWDACEEQKRGVAELQKAIEYEELKIAVDKSMDSQLGGLEDLSGQISQLRVSHNKLSSALNTTRQQISLVDVQNLSEDELTKSLSETECLLADILSHRREDIPKLSALSAIHGNLLETVEKEYLELEQAQKELSSTIKLQLQEISLNFEEIQRNDITHLSP